MGKKIVLVTGGSRGIGASICKRLAREGFFVYVNYRNDLSGAEQTADEIIKWGGQCDIIQFNVSDPSDVARGIEKFKVTESGLDVLVNNAGISIDNLIVELTVDEIERVIDTNFFAVCSVYKACREMLKAASGTVISIGSIAGIKGKVGQAIYAVSKAMIIEWTFRMAELEKEDDLKFYCISPGPVLTDLINTTPWMQDPKAKNRVPMNRFVEPDEIGEIALSLVRNRAAFKNGYNLIYDGGFLQTVRE